MTKDILFYNEIGRQGKSSLAYNFYDWLKKDGQASKYVTNDMANISFSAVDLLKNDLVEIKPGESVSIDTDDFNIFDFGGFLDNRIIDVVEHVKYVVIPISYSSNSELTLTAQVIQTLNKYNKNIVVVFNKTKTAKVTRGKQMFKTLIDALKLDVAGIFVVNESEFMTRLADFDLSILDVAEAGKGDKKQLEKKIIPQLNELYSYLIK